MNRWYSALFFQCLRLFGFRCLPAELKKFRTGAHGKSDLSSVLKFAGVGRPELQDVHRWEKPQAAEFVLLSNACVELTSVDTT